MSDQELYDSGFEEFQKMMEMYQITQEHAITAMEAGVKQLVNDVRKLPKPRSQMAAPGYTHLLDTITYRKTKKEIETGWGKYYGPMVEKGTVKMKGTPHIMTTFERNEDRYYDIMIKQIFR